MQKEAQTMKLPDVTKILNNKTLQEVAGVYIQLNSQAAQSGLSTTQVAEAIFNGALTTPHIPNLQHVMNDLTGGLTSLQLKQYIKLYLVGEAAKMIGIGAKYGNLASNFAKNAAKGAVIASLVTHATIWNSPGPDAGSYTKRNFALAPTVNGYGYP